MRHYFNFGGVSEWLAKSTLSPGTEIINLELKRPIYRPSGGWCFRIFDFDPGSRRPRAIGCVEFLRDNQAEIKKYRNFRDPHHSQTRGAVLNFIVPSLTTTCAAMNNQRRHFTKSDDALIQIGRAHV